MKQQIVEKQQRKKEMPVTREEKAKAMLMNGGVIRLVEKVVNYKVQSATHPDKYYFVSVENQTKYTCECPDFTIRSEINKDHKCKHIILVRLAEEYSLIKQETIKSDIESEPNPKAWRDADYEF